MEKEEKPRYELVEVPTQTTWLIRDTKADKLYEDKELLLEIINKLDRIEKGII